MLSFRDGKEREAPKVGGQRKSGFAEAQRRQWLCSWSDAGHGVVTRESGHRSSRHDRSGSPRSSQLRKNERDTNRQLRFSEKCWTCMMVTNGMTDALSFLLPMVCLAFRKHVC